MSDRPVISDDGFARVEKHQTSPGVCVSYWGTMISNKDHPRDTFVFYGKDVSGNYWVHGYLRPETWELMQEEFRGYAGE